MLLVVNYYYEDKIVQKKFTGNDEFDMLGKARKDENYAKCIKSEYEFFSDEE